MAGIRRIISGELSQTKSRGKAFLAEMWGKLKPASIAKKTTGKK